MSKFVLDASAVLALLQSEAGAEQVEKCLPQALISTVNLAEVVTRLSLQGMTDEPIREVVGLLGLRVVPFGEEQSFLAGLLAAQTRTQGLALGDRACLALAMTNQAIAVTADRAWKELDIGVKIHLVR